MSWRILNNIPKDIIAINSINRDKYIFEIKRNEKWQSESSKNMILLKEVLKPNSNIRFRERPPEY